MPLVDDVRSFLEKTGGKPRLSTEMIALCHVLDEKLSQKIDKLPPRHAGGTEPSITAKPTRGRKPA